MPRPAPTVRERWWLRSLDARAARSCGVPELVVHQAIRGAAGRAMSSKIRSRRWNSSGAASPRPRRSGRGCSGYPVAARGASLGDDDLDVRARDPDPVARARTRLGSRACAASAGRDGVLRLGGLMPNRATCSRNAGCCGRRSCSCPYGGSSPCSASATECRGPVGHAAESRVLGTGRGRRARSSDLDAG